MVYYDERLERFLLQETLRLQNRAKETGTPINPADLENLFITYPPFVFSLYEFNNWNSNHEPSSFDKLDERELAPFDPQWRALVEFKYQLGNSSYTFHLSPRVCEKFISSEELAQLLVTQSRDDAGEYFGRAITEEESIENPVERILDELGVDIFVMMN